MQPIQRTSYPDAQPGSPAGIAGYLAALIDQQARQARTHALAASPMRRKLGLPAPWDANALVWVEDAASPGPVAVRDRGMMVVAHGPEQASGGRTYVISYPETCDPDASGLDASGPGASGGRRQRIATVTLALAGMGWQLLARKVRRTDAGNANTAVLVCTARPGVERRLWLAEPSGGLAGLHDASLTMPAAAPGTRNQVEAWVNEGGAGDDAR